MRDALRTVVLTSVVTVLLLSGVAPASAYDQLPETPPPGATAEVRDVSAQVRDVTAEVRDLVVEAPTGTTVTVQADVLFAFGSAELPAEAQGQLAGVVAEIQAAAPGSVLIEGHTDSISDTAFNQTLSEQRAEAVRAYLSGALPGLVMTGVGHGETQPIAEETNPDGSDNPAGRAQNRRVTITLTP